MAEICRLKKNPMPSQDPDVRNKNFQEVALGYTEEQALDEAAALPELQEPALRVSGCPVNVHIPDFIAKVAEGDFEEAYQIISPDQLPARRLRSCLPAGEPVREATASAASRASPWASAVWSALWPTGTTPTAPRPS